MQFPEKIWHNGAIKPWAEATTHVMAHAIHYGSSVFEGIRAYDTPKGTAIFRLTDHNRRLFASARIYDMEIPYTLEQINAACREVLKANDLRKAYLRPVAYRGLGGFGLSAQTPIDVAVAAWEMGPYLGEGVLEAGHGLLVGRLGQGRFQRVLGRHGRLQPVGRQPGAPVGEEMAERLLAQVQVQHRDPSPAVQQGRGQVNGQRGLARAALLVADHDDLWLGHV